MTFDKNNENLLKENKNRFTLFPIDPEYQDIWDLYKQALSSFWTVDEIDFSSDIVHWNERLNDNERYFIKNILAFFAGSDGIVNENLAINFYSEIQIPEVRNLYATQILIESVHSEAYSLMIDTYVSNTIEKQVLFNAIETIPAVKKKAEWALKYIDNGDFNERLLAFLVVEGIHFSGSFAAIYWLRSRGLMPGLCMANQFISRDEGLHASTAVMLYSKLTQKLSTEKVHNIFKEAFEIEKEFITESLPVSLIGMNSNLMIEYIEYVTDFWLAELNYPKIFNTSNPFPFMEYISLENKTNFFEKRVSEYKKAENSGTFTINADF